VDILNAGLGEDFDVRWSHLSDSDFAAAMFGGQGGGEATLDCSVSVREKGRR